tara:strand:- start:1488 stop:1778 length:291 start_codon:yes stop_codon:yes gene_type:complete
MNISTNRTAQKCIISLVLAATCPDGQEDKFKRLKEWADTSKDQLLVEVQQFLFQEADRLVEDEDEFDLYYKNFSSVPQVRAEHLSSLKRKTSENKL